MASAAQRVAFLCVSFSLVFGSLSLVTTPSPCANGFYEHEGAQCCLCAAGLRLSSHCVKVPDDSVCELCDQGTYSSHPNAQQTCEPCKSCDEPNAGLEVDEPCTSARNTKCRCKEGYYCSSNKESCKLCQACSECATEGVKVACTATNDTVCNDKPGGGDGWKIATVCCAILGLIAIVAVVYWKRRKMCSEYSIPVGANNDVADVEMQPLKGLEPYLGVVAETLGWTDMRHVAMRSGIAEQAIESCQLNHPSQTEEQTIQLLRKFLEKNGQEASAKLIGTLNDMGKKNQAEKVSAILRK